MRHHHSEIRQRDLDGMFDVVTGDTIAGPFPTIVFAIQVASGDPPAPAAPSVKFRIRRTHYASA